MICIEASSKSLEIKGIGKTLTCFPENKRVENIGELHNYVSRFINTIVNNSGCKLVFRDNEPIGGDYILYRYNLVCERLEGYMGIRIVTYNNFIEQVTLTINKYYDKILNTASLNIMDEEELLRTLHREHGEYYGVENIRGQLYIPNFIIYRILGQPEIDLDGWVLEIKGLVKHTLRLRYNDLEGLEHVRIHEDFHCVTGWSVKNNTWEGIPLRTLAEMAGVSNAEWVYVRSLDGYSTIIPLRDFLSDKSILALKLNGKPLTIEQGFPARIIIPHLYGWKNAKWVYEIIFTDKYINGYWEALGYHWRGNIYLNERFKRIR